MTATTRELVEAVVGGESGAPQRLAEALAAAATSAERSALLDPLAAAAVGSGRALEVLLRVVHGEHLAMAAIHRLVVDRHDAEDVEQDVLVNVARSIGSFRSDARFTTWLHTVARNTAVDFLRRRRETLSLDEAAPLTAAARMSSVIATRAVVRAAVADLPPEYREPVTLRDLEHLPYQEIADRLGLNLNTTKSRIFRGRALLAGAVAGLDTVDPVDPVDPGDAVDPVESPGDHGG